MSARKESVSKTAGRAPKKAEVQDPLGAGAAGRRRLLADRPLGRLVGPDAMKFGGWQRLNAEYAKQFGVETPGWPGERS